MVTMNLGILFRGVVVGTLDSGDFPDEIIVLGWSDRTPPNRPSVEVCTCVHVYTCSCSVFREGTIFSWSVVTTVSSAPLGYKIFLFGKSIDKGYTCPLIFFRRDENRIH